MFNFLYCEDNIVIAAAVSGATALISIAMVLLMNTVFKGNRTMTLIATVASFLMAIVSTLFCYNLVVLAGYIISVIATAIGLTKLSTIVHQNSIYANISSLHRFSKFIIPLSVFFGMFRPFFVDCKEEGEIGFYSLWSAFGLRCNTIQTNKWTGKTTSINAGINPYSVDFDKLSIVSIITLILFVVVLAMQVILIWRQFADPDNARDWADAGIIVTCIGALFIYGMFTSNNFAITKYSVEYTAANLYVVVALGALNRLLYFEKVENKIDKISSKLFKKA